MQLQTTSPESKFPNEYSDVIFIQIDQHLKKLLQKYKGGPDFMKHGVCCADRSWIFFFLVMEKSREINVEKEGHPVYVTVKS